MFRLLAAVAVISLSGCLSAEQWPLHVLLISLMWGGAVLCGARLDSTLRRLALFLPFVLAIGVGVPATQTDGTAWSWTLTIVCRALVAFFAGVWLVHALPFQELRIVLRRLHVSELFLDALAFMHRYSVVLWDELARIRTARRARSGRLTWFRTWTTSAYLIGELLIRAWDRADRVHRAMLARGSESGAAAGSTP